MVSVPLCRDEFPVFFHTINSIQDTDLDSFRIHRYLFNWLLCLSKRRLPVETGFINKNTLLQSFILRNISDNVMIISNYSRIHGSIGYNSPEEVAGPLGLSVQLGVNQQGFFRAEVPCILCNHGNKVTTHNGSQVIHRGVIF